MKNEDDKLVIEITFIGKVDDRPKYRIEVTAKNRNKEPETATAETNDLPMAMIMMATAFADG